MTYLDNIKKQLGLVLDCSPRSFVYPPTSDLGDLSLPMFEEAKKLGLSPIVLAQEKAKNIPSLPGFKEIKAVGPYLNFYLEPLNFISGAISDVTTAGQTFGNNDSGQAAGVMIEYSNGNTHKEIHIGHLRNVFYGDAVYKILAANGYDAIPVSYINDFGIHTAKTIWNWQNNPAYGKSTAPKGYLLGKCYSEAAQKIGDDPQAKEEVSLIMKEIENRQGAGYEFWKESRQWSINYFNEFYKELGIKFQDTFYESDFVDQGLKLKDDLLAQGILKLSEGAIIADLEEYNLGILPVIRSDGTALYPVADLALASAKFKKYQLKESIYIVDVRQSLYFSQLFKLVELLGYKEKMTHLSYDFLTTKNGMMASRTGNVITYKELLDEALSHTSKEVSKRHEDWSEEKIQQTARGLAISAMKFEMIKVSSDKVITFDMVDALRFEGFTSAYLQYTGARICSLLKKGEASETTTANLNELIEPKEFRLAMKLEQYGEAVLKSGLERDPSVVARYLFELAQDFNDYYHETNIIKAETETRKARLALVLSVKTVLENGFNLLGLTYLIEM
ncbi:MAG: arginine--tRNA ligase [Candidatus Falkowbacteria bacterium]